MIVHLVQISEFLLEVGSREPVGQQSQTRERVEQISSRDNSFSERGHKSFGVGDETLVGVNIVESIGNTHDDGSKGAGTRGKYSCCRLEIGRLTIERDP